MNVVNVSNDLICSAILQAIELENPDIIILPNNYYKNQIPNNYHSKILTFEGLDITNILPNFKIDILSRNETYAIITEILQNAKILPIEERDIPIFARATIGELPNIKANKMTPETFLAKIPAKIATQSEINIKSFIAVWREFEKMAKNLKKMPYYSLQSIQLEEVLHYCITEQKKIIIVGDGEKSAIYNNFIQNAITQKIGTVILHNFQNENGINCTQVKERFLTEGQEVAEIAKYLTENSYKKIGIICVENALGQTILQELKAVDLISYSKNGKPALANVFIRMLSFIIERNIKEILPMLKISSKEKIEILKSITENESNSVTIWREIENLCNLKESILEKTEKICEFLLNNLSNFHHNVSEIEKLKEFVTSFGSEISKLEEFKIKAGKEFFRHFVSSWKIWEKDEKGSDVDVISVEEAYLTKFDAIILTSKAVKEEDGNIIFSQGLRKYFGFSNKDYQSQMLQNINAPIFATSSCHYLPHIQKKTLELTLNNKHAQKKQKVLISTPEKQKPAIVSATALETLIESPAKFYYKYVKFLKSPQYNLQTNLDLGNIVHEILEIATKKPDIALQNITKFFKNYEHRAIFYQKTLEKLINEIEAKINDGFKIQAETKFSIQLGNFTLTARCDRIDTSPNNEITIYDYKAGSSTAFTKNAITKTFKKIQLYIPALEFAKHGPQNLIEIKYSFIQNKESKEIAVEITPELLQAFEDITTQSLEKYFVYNEPFELNGEHYAI